MRRSLLVFACAFAFHCITNGEASFYSRSKRFLTFPRQAPTRYQFIGGIGIPADLEYESLTVGHVLKAQFYLPYNATVFRENPYWPEYMRNASNPDNNLQARTRHSNLRWELYEYLEKRLDSYGYHGHECVLKAICEANALPFLRHHSIFADLLHIFLSPSKSNDFPSRQSSEFMEAERLGHTTTDCDVYFCGTNLLDLVSSVLKVF